MKKITLIAFSSLLFLSACSGETSNSSPSSNFSEEGIEQPNSTEESVQTSDSTETTGGFNYFVLEAPTGFTESALKRACFTPAQLDPTNNGDMFCFTNTDEALAGLNIEPDANCKEYVGAAKIQIKNLSTDVPRGLKSDACFTEGTCEFNEAEFVAVQEMMMEATCKS